MVSKFLRRCPAIDGEIGYVDAPIWGAASEFIQDRFQTKGSAVPTRFETIDLPELYQQG